jgi:4-amino-4-deoxy-L-arabinose transferase-like glycosyltransferase
MTRPGAPLALAMLLWATLTAIGLITRPPLPVDETRYLAVAWEMWQRGDFLVPYINGIPYHHKPPLLFWLMQAGWTVFGVSEIWARLVAPLFALGSILLTNHLAKLLWPETRDVGPLAALVLTGATLFGVFISITFFDTLVTFFAVLGWIGLVHAARASRDGRSMRMGWAIYAVALGLGVLSKGPVQLVHVLPVALLAPFWKKDRPAGFARRWYAALGLAVLCGAAIALAWAVPAAIAGGAEFARKIFLGQSTGRMVDSFQHARPFWWYVPAIFVMLFPWLWWVALWRRGFAAALVWREARTRFCLCILVPAFVIFSAISGKQPHYMLPLAAAASLVIARLFATPGEDRRWERAWPLLLIALCGVALIAAPLYAARLIEARPGLVFPGWLQGVSVVSGAVLIAGSIAAVRVASTRAAIAALSTLSIALLAALHVGLLALRPTFEVDRIAAFLRQAESAGTPVAILGDYEGQFHFAGRLTRPIVDVNHTTALTWAAEHPDGLLITVPQSVTTDATPALVARYRGRQAVIWHARDVAARGVSLLNH